MGINRRYVGFAIEPPALQAGTGGLALAKTIFKRLVHSIPILFVVVTITFFVTRILPSDPAVAILGAEATPEDLAQLRESMGFNESYFSQYIDYIAGLLQGNLGHSYVHKQPVSQLIANVLPNTITLAVGGMIIAVLLGIPLGILAATHRNKSPDHAVSVLTLCGVSTPIFWLGLILALIFGVKLGWLPVMGRGSLEQGAWDYLSHMILPLATISTVPLANVVIITRSSIIDVVNKDFYKTLVAYGMPKRIIRKHMLKNALPAIINVIGIQLASALTGAILTDTVFNWPGMGKLAADAITSRDYTLVQGCVLFMTIVYVIVNLIADIIACCVNPQSAKDT